MFRKNIKHQQPALIPYGHDVSAASELPEKQRKRLESSWTGTFYKEFFSRNRIVFEISLWLMLAYLVNASAFFLAQSSRNLAEKFRRTLFATWQLGKPPTTY